MKKSIITVILIAALSIPFIGHMTTSKIITVNNSNYKQFAHVDDLYLGEKFKVTKNLFGTVRRIKAVN